MNNFEPILAIDLGQSGCRILMPDGTRLELDEFYEPKSEIVSKVEQIFVRLGNVRADTVLLSLTGLNGRVHSTQELTSIANKYTRCSKLACCDDGFAWNLGALAGENGAIIAAGGGAVAVGRNNQKFSHVDGKGYELGDQGSAYWIGIESLRLAIKSKEGRAEETKLVKLAEDFFGDLTSLPHKKLTSIQLHSSCIKFAENIFTLIEKDELATKILIRAADELANSVIAACKKVDLKDAQVCSVGGLFKNDWFSQTFEERVKVKEKSYTVISPKGDALAGLALIPKQLLGINNQLLEWCKI